MRIIRRIIFQLLCLLGACCYIPATAQVVLVDNGKTKSRIILSKIIRRKTEGSNTFTFHNLFIIIQNISKFISIVPSENFRLYISHCKRAECKKRRYYNQQQNPSWSDRRRFQPIYERWNLTYFRQWEWDSLRSCNFTRTISWSGLLGRKRILF